MNHDPKNHTLRDGRSLTYCEYGSPNGVPVFYAHGGPGSRLEGSMYHDKAVECGLRIIAMDRPGMGRSTFKPDRVLLDYPKDVAELADALGLRKFGVMGHSGGGAHTAVCGVALADRLLFNVLLAGYTNFAELPGAADMLTTAADRMAVRLWRRFPRLFGLMFDLMAFSIKYLPGEYYRSVAQAGNETDKKIFAQPAFKEHFLADQKEAMIQGGKGVTVDAAVHYMDWGISLKEIPGKVHIFYGTEDNFVPMEYTRHLEDNILNCEIHWLDGQGHLFPWDHQEGIFQAVLQELEVSRR